MDNYHAELIAESNRRLIEALGMHFGSPVYARIRDPPKTAAVPMEESWGTNAQAPRDPGYIGILY